MNGLNPSIAPWSASQGLTPLASATAVVIKTADPAKRHYVTGLQICNIHTTQAVVFQILDGASVIWATNLPPLTVALQQINPDAHFDVPLIGTINTALSIKCSAAGSVFWNIQGFDAP